MAEHLAQKPQKAMQVLPWRQKQIASLLQICLSDSTKPLNVFDCYNQRPKESSKQ